MMGYYLSPLSDVYSLWALYVNPVIPKVLFGVYAGIFAISLCFNFVETNIAARRLESQDFSAIILDQLACSMYVVRSFDHLCLVDKAKSKFGLTDMLVVKVMNGLQNGRRLVFVTVPQAICMLVALTFKSQGASNLSIAISVIPFVIKFVLLYDQLSNLFVLICLYPFLRCCIKVRERESMSLWDYMNLMVEKILNKLLKEPGAASNSGATPQAV